MKYYMESFGWVITPIAGPRLDAVGYTFTCCPDAADLSMAAMTSWRPTASAKSGTV